MCFGVQERSAQSKQIDEALQDERNASRGEVKLLLLGAGDSGKSTIAKQMKILYLHGFSEEERKNYISIIQANVLNSVKFILKGVSLLGYRLDMSLEEISVKLYSGVGSQVIKPEALPVIKSFWSDRVIQQTVARGDEFHLPPAARYFMERLDQIVDAGYVPSEEDILRCKVVTTGIAEMHYEMEGIKFRVVDMGGQRSERRKWIHFFDGVTAVIFVVALNEYNMKLMEDDNVNRMHESMEIFSHLLLIPQFSRTTFIIFFNKVDLFREKLKTVDLRVCFPDYQGGSNEVAGAQFILQNFLRLNGTMDRKIFTHVTCATNTENVKVVMSAVKFTIMNQLSNMGM